MMIQKQVTDLTIDDLEKNPVWSYVVDELDADEMTVKPATRDKISDDSPIIVKCIFKNSSNKEYVGYINWQAPFTIEALQPVLVFNSEIKIFFWQGMFPPEPNYINEIKKAVGDGFFPIHFESDAIFRLKSLTGTLEGIYHWNRDKTVLVTKI